MPRWKVRMSFIITAMVSANEFYYTAMESANEFYYTAMESANEFYNNCDGKCE